MAINEEALKQATDAAKDAGQGKGAAAFGAEVARLDKEKTDANARAEDARRKNGW